MEQQGYQKAPGLPQQQSVFSKDHHALPIVGHSDWRRELRKAILTRVVPRLSDIGREADASVECAPVAVTEDQVTHFADLLLAAAVPQLIHYIEVLRSEGLGIDAVLLELLAPAARRLGDLWLDARLSFIAVKAGLSR